MNGKNKQTEERISENHYASAQSTLVLA